MSKQLTPEEVLYKHLHADSEEKIKSGKIISAETLPLEELKDNEFFQMHVAAMKEYASQPEGGKEVKAPAEEWKADLLKRLGTVLSNDGKINVNLFAKVASLLTEAVTNTERMLAKPCPPAPPLFTLEQMREAKETIETVLYLTSMAAGSATPSDNAKLFHAIEHHCNNWLSSLTPQTQNNEK